MQGNIEYDIFSMILLLIVFISFRREKVQKNRLVRLFYAILFSAVFTCFANIIAVVVLNFFPWLTAVFMYSRLLRVSGLCLTAFLMLVYLIALCNPKSLHRMKLINRICFYLPIILALIHIVISIFTKSILYYNSNGVLSIGNGQYFLYVVMIYYLICTGVLILQGGRSFNNAQKIPMYITFLCLAAGLIVTRCFTNKNLLDLVGSIAILAIYMILQHDNDQRLASNRIHELEQQKRLLEEKTNEANEARMIAQQADRAKTQFLANMSHEIRTPLNAIIGLTELVLREDISFAVRDNAINIKQAGKSLLGIINNILDISKIESGKMELHKETYSFAQLMKDVVNMITTRLEGKDIEFLVELDDSIPQELIGDEVMVRQILVNLLNNAVKYTETGFIRLVINCIHEDSVVILDGYVEDSGQGIRRKDLEHIFDSFRRADGCQNQSVEGTGLGLAICRKTLELMGGSIGVESIYDEGSRFSFTMPQIVDDQNLSYM